MTAPLPPDRLRAMARAIDPEAVERLTLWLAANESAPDPTLVRASVKALLADRERLRLALESLQGYRGRLDRKKLRRIFDQWNREEIESIELIEAVGAFLGAEPRAALNTQGEGE